MKIGLTTQPIDYEALVEEARSSASGAVVLFLGTVREFSEGREVRGLSYEAYPPMAEKKLAEILEAARDQWRLDWSGVIHRHGELDLGDVAVAVVTASAHRAEAFDAARWIMDTIKQSVPIWKKENFVTGDSQWVHPSSDETRPSPLPGTSESRS